MLFQEPKKTQYDLNFNLFGFPVSVHPLFFAISFFFGRSAIESGNNLGLNAGVSLLVVIAVFFLSILIHELGHAFAYRYFGHGARIVLYWLGGLAISDQSSVWNRRLSLGSNQKIIVSLAGPVLGMLFGMLLVGIVYAVGGTVEFVPPSFVGEQKNVFPALIPIFSRETVDSNPALVIFLFSGLYINLFWNLMNLVPVYPLDGGQIARELFMQHDKTGDPVRNSAMLSIISGGLVCVLGLISGDFFIAFLFGYLAYQSYVAINPYGGRRW